MSENYIHGIDEAGRIGDNIIFCESSVPIYNENYLMIKNLDAFNKLILNKYDISGIDVKNLIKFARNACDDPVIKVKLYSLNHQNQNKLLSIMYLHLSQRLFYARGQLIEYFHNNDSAIIQRTLNTLNSFKRKAIFAESYVKSYAIKKIVEKVGKVYLDKYSQDNLIDDTGPRINILIDGGYPFSFWWPRIIGVEESGLNLGKCLILGISNADNHYPIVSLSGTVASIIEKIQDKRYYFEINPLEINIDQEEMRDYSHYHHRSLSRPYYQNRLLIIGDYCQDTYSILPYVAHIGERRLKTFEPFKIDTNVEHFMKDFGYGSPDDTLIMKGNLNTDNHRRSLSFCEERGYTIKEFTDYQDSFESIFASLSDEINYGSSYRRSTLQSRLTRIKTACEADLQ